MALLQDALSPYFTLVEGTTPASPSSGDQRLFVRSSDHLLCLINSSGIVTPVGSGFANPMTTKGDVITGDTSGVATRLAAGTSGFVLTSNGAAAFPSWQAAGGASLSSFDAPCSGAVTMTTANTFYDAPGCSNACAAGTWLILYKALFNTTGSSQTRQYTVKLWDGSTVYDEEENDSGASIGSDWFVEVSGFAIVVLASPATLKISGTSVRNGDIIARDSDTNSAGSHKVTRLSGIKLG